MLFALIAFAICCLEGVNTSSILTLSGNLMSMDQPECRAEMGYNSDITFRWLLKGPNGTDSVLSDRPTPDTKRYISY